MLFERRVAANGRRVIDEQRRFVRRYTPTPFVAATPEMLATTGFVEELATGGAQYYAPDATVLLSDPFLNTHCFRLRTREDEGVRLLGLEFEPIQGRDNAEVRGVLWLEEATARLRSIEYRYVNHPLRLPDSEAGGELAFTELPNGTWIVREWRIRMPNLLQELDGRGTFRRWVIDGYTDTGGAVQQATTNTGTVVMDVARGGITGVVVDSAGRPAAGALVRLQVSGSADTTDVNGAFSFTDVGEGVWSVGAAMPDARDLGFVASAEVDVRATGMTPARIVLPSVADVALERCPAEPAGPGRTVLLVRVVDADGAPVPRALVRVSWDLVTSSGGSPGATSEWVDLSTDAEGVFVYCEPDRRRIRIEAQAGSSRARPIEVEIPPGDGVTTATVVLR
jgi:hypothetical protein